jgi:hypothetical protein
MGTSQRPLPNHTQHSQKTYIFDPDGIPTNNPSKRGQQTEALDRAATGIGV